MQRVSFLAATKAQQAGGKITACSRSMERNKGTRYLSPQGPCDPALNEGAIEEGALRD